MKLWKLCKYTYTRLLGTNKIISYLFRIQTVSQVLVVVKYHEVIHTGLGHCASQVHFYPSEGTKGSLGSRICCWHQQKELKYSANHLH